MLDHNADMTSRTRSWLPPVIGAVVFIAVLLGAGMIAGDWVKRNTEMRALVAQIEVSEQAMEDTQLAVHDALTGFEGKAPLSEDNEAALDELLKDAASKGLREVTAAGALVNSVRVLPWHGDISEVQRARRLGGVLIIGSGYLTHGLPFLRDSRPHAAPPGWSVDFDLWAAEARNRGDVDALASYRQSAPGMPYAHPTVEHGIPLLITLGAATDSGVPPQTVTVGYFFGLSKRSIQVA